MHQHEKIDYVEFPSSNLSATKAFFESAFGWSFTDFGPDYTAFADQGIEGGFFQSELASRTENGAALIIFYSEFLEQTLVKVERCGGMILKPITHFPGGRRFQFAEPSGGEFAVWSDREASGELIRLEHAPKGNHAPKGS